jgi:hypothetical protein
MVSLFALLISKTLDTGEKLPFCLGPLSLADEHKQQVIDIFETIFRANKP